MPESKELHGFIVTQAEGLTDEQRENNRRWVEALRSGEYAQINNCLKDDGGYCCLGVACEILGSTWADTNFGLQADGFSDLTLSRVRQNDLGCGHAGPIAFKGNEELTAMELNDEEGLSFPQIADIIEYWAGLTQEEVAR